MTHSTLMQTANHLHPPARIRPLLREKHNKAMQQIVDLLLAARPLLDAGTVFRFLLLPRMQEEAKAMQAAFDCNVGAGALACRGVAVNGGIGLPALLESRATALCARFLRLSRRRWKRVLHCRSA